MTDRIPKKLQPSVLEWCKYWRRLFKLKHCRMPPDKTMHLLGGVCATQGTRDSEIGRETYFALSNLLANPSQQAKITKVVSILSENVEYIDRVVACVQAYNKFILKNDGKALDKGRYPLDRVVRTMIEVPRAEPYVKSFVQTTLRTPNAVFHPRTLARAKKELKGVFSYDAGDHENQLKNKVQIIE